MAVVKFISTTDEQTLECSIKDAPFDDHGKPASLLALALREGFFIDHACGGVGACSTCHVIVEKGGSHLTPADDNEEDMLDNAPGLTLRSRLACQAEITTDAATFEVHIPAVNRNLLSEHR